MEQTCNFGKRNFPSRAGLPACARRILVYKQGLGEHECLSQRNVTVTTFPSSEGRARAALLDLQRVDVIGGVGFQPGDHRVAVTGVSMWSAAMDVGGWLCSLGLDQYEANFRENKIGGMALSERAGRGAD